MRRMVALVLVLLATVSAAQAQFFDKLSNPTTSVTLKHPRASASKSARSPSARLPARAPTRLSRP